MSVRVVLDLLDQLTNTRVLSLFHNRMGQSRYSEVSVNLVQHCLIVTWLVTCATADNGFSPFCHELFRLHRWSLCFHERNVFWSPGNGTIFLHKIDVDPTSCVLMSSPCFMQVLCMTRYTQVDHIRIHVIFVHKINRQTEYCLSFAQKLWAPGINPELMIECKLIAHPTWYIFLFPSSSCHAFLPLVVRPMMTIQEMFLKIVFVSPEFNCSIIFSR